MVAWIILGVIVLVVAVAVITAIVIKNNKDKIAKAEATAKSVIADIKK
jgi:hypothetical protein